MKYRKWNIGEADRTTVDTLQSAGYSGLLASVLAARGVRTPEEAAEKLDRERKLTFSPLLMKDMDRAAARIQQAVSGGETVAVFGDYDVDGITATVLLKFAEELSRAILEKGQVYGIPANLFEENCQIFLVPMVDPDGVDLVTGGIARGSIQWEQAKRLSNNYRYALSGIHLWHNYLFHIDLYHFSQVLLQDNPASGYIAPHRVRSLHLSAASGRVECPPHTSGSKPIYAPHRVESLVLHPQSIDPSSAVASHTSGRC